MAAYAELQAAEFAAEADGYTATRHQREVGTGYFDAVLDGGLGRQVVDHRDGRFDRKQPVLTPTEGAAAGPPRAGRAHTDTPEVTPCLIPTPPTGTPSLDHTADAELPDAITILADDFTPAAMEYHRRELGKRGYQLAGPILPRTFLPPGGPRRAGAAVRRQAAIRRHLRAQAAGLTQG